MKRRNTPPPVPDRETLERQLEALQRDVRQLQLERVKGEWWITDGESGKVRDYFIIEVESGERFWVFRTGDGQHEGTGSLNWYLHGQFC